MAKILEFPNTNNLSESVKILRKELLDTVYKYDEILVHESYQLKIEYIRTFGSIEYKYLSKKLVYNKLKEEKYLLGKYIDKYDFVDFKRLDKIISQKFHKEEIELDEKLMEINEALNENTKNSLSNRDQRQFEKSYKNIITKIHPLINNNLSPSKADLYINSLLAFTYYDFVSIRTIDDMLDRNLGENYRSKPTNILYKEKQNLEKSIEDVNIKIDSLYEKDPWIYKKLLASTREINKKYNKISKKIDSLDIAIRSLQEEIKILLEMYHEK